MNPVLSPGRVAVVTGGASGIGLATCKRLAERGMRVVIVDVNDENLETARERVAKLAKSADDVIACKADVSQRAELESLRDEVYDRFGEVAFLMNNAAAFLFGPSLGEAEPWERTFAVNVMGVVHGVQVFVPKMLEQETPCVVVNTGSKQGITNPPGMPNYNAAKAAVKSLTESLQHDLRNVEGGQVSAHLLVPGFTTTGGRDPMPGAWAASQVADHLLDAIERGDFYVICPDNEVTFEMDRKRMLWGTMDITENRPPLTRWHPDYEQVFEDFDPDA
jgi:NAD(P)-dependent dehydrogenase (short-subunit alcohol dehydrogenase family)